MARIKKKKRLIRFDEDDDAFIVMHAAKRGNTFQSFVEHSVKKEIKFLKGIEESEKKRKAKNTKTE